MSEPSPQAEVNDMQLATTQCALRGAAPSKATPHNTPAASSGKTAP